MKTDYLMHHGILGQRWGIRRFQNKDGSYTAAGKDRYGDKSERKNKGLTDEQKALAKKIAIGAAVVAGTALAAYGAYKLYDSGVLNDALDKFVKKGENSVKENIRKGGQSVSSNNNKSLTNEEELRDKIPKKYLEKGLDLANKTQFKMQDTASNAIENLEKCNEGWTPDNDNPLKDNCGHAVIAWLLRSYGLDVQAKGVHGDLEGGVDTTQFRRYFDFKSKDRKLTPVTISKNNNVDDCKRTLARKILESCNGEDSLGVWECQLNTGGHWMAYVVKNGKVSFVNPQNGGSNCDLAFKKLALGLVNSDKVIFSRLDDLDINLDHIYDAVENYTHKGGKNG